jgi:ABC-type dipeptide/oligopeptide/nickel transport system permease component
MLGYLIRRLAYSIFVLWGAVTIVFVVLRVVPGDPALVILGPDASPADVARLRHGMGLDQPLLVQYGHYLLDVARLHFGDSVRLGGDAMGQILLRLPATAELALAAVVFAVTVGIGLGVAAASRPNSFLDRVISVFTLVIQSTPTFWAGLVLLLIFARQLRVLPSEGAHSWQNVILPAITLGLGFLAMVTRLTRSGLLEVSHESYLNTVRAKGLSERVVVFPHAIRNALIPVVTVIGLYLGSVLGGTVVIETVFAWPGAGRLIADSIGYRDYNVVQAGVILIAAIFVVVNLLVDLLYGLIDPRVSVGRQER